MTAPLKPSSPGLGSAVFEFPQGAKRPAPEPRPEPQPEPTNAHTLNLLRHLPAGHFKQYVGDVALMCSIHPSTSLLIALGTVSSVTSRVYAVQYQNGDTLPTGEYVIAGGLPGDAKSRLLKSFQRPIFDAHKETVKAYRAEKKAFEEDPENEGKKFKKPYPIKIFITDTTTEALEPVLEESSGYFSLASAEQAVVNTLVGASYGGEGRKNNNDLPLKGFNAEYHASSRTTRTGYTGTVVGAITCFAQPAAIATILDRSEGSGVAERFLMVEEPTQQGTRDHTRQHYPQEYSQNVYNRIVKDIAALALEQPQDFDDLQAWRISKADWHKIYLFRNEIEPHLVDGGKYSTATMRGMASKVDMHVMKVSALLACLYEHPVGEIPSQFIDAAIGIMKDMLDNALSLLFKIGVVGFSAEESKIIDFMGNHRNGTYRNLIKTRLAGVKLFKEQQKPSKAIGETIDRLIQKGVLSELPEYGSDGRESLTIKLIA